MEASPDTVALADYTDDPANYSHATEDAFARLVEKVRAVPDGLRAQRIAYVTDDPRAPRLVIAGNKRLRALRKIYGDDGRVPAEWFVDVTAMTPALRREFAVVTNVNEGRWVVDGLRRLLSDAELRALLDEKTAADLLDAVASPQRIGEGEEVDLSDAPTDIKLVVEIPSGLAPAVRGLLARYDNDPARALVRLAQERTAAK